MGGGQPVDGDTIFEIGSVTKVFTALLLADMVAKGEVALTDPVSKYLPATVKLAGSKPITLEQLATHTSGLPRLPSNFAPKDVTNPYADYTPEKLYEFLASHRPAGEPGSRYDYSNLGTGLLGHALALRAGTDFETLVRKRILEPLGMKSTSFAVPEESKARLAAGHDASLAPARNWEFSALAGVGALRSTANDMLTFLAAAMGLVESPLAKPMAAMLAARRTSGTPGLEIALGWHIAQINGRDIVWHNGGTGGYRSFVGFDPKRRAGVVVLSNVSTAAGVDDIGIHLLDDRAPLLPAPKERKEVTLDAKTLERYVGRYQLAPEFILTVSRDGDRLFVQATGQPKLEVFASAESEFFYKAVEAEISFVAEKDGTIASLVLHQNGRHMPAKKMN